MATKRNFNQFQFEGLKNGQEEAPCSGDTHRYTEIVYPLSKTGVEKCLPKTALIQLKGNHSGEKIQVNKGIVWMTQLGSEEDHLLRSGEAFEITEKGGLLIEAMAETRIKITGTHRTLAALGGAVQHVTGLIGRHL